MLAAAALSVFLPLLDAGFLGWDDGVYVTGNALVRNLSLAAVREMFTSFHLGLYKPLTLLSLAVEYRLFGPDPAAFHAVGILLHFANCLLAYALLRRLSGSAAAALFGAMLFCVHPMRVQSVAWVAERKDLLFALFFLLSLLGYESYLSSGSRRSYLLSLGAFLLSLGAKPMGVSLPLALLLMDWLRGRRIDRRAALEKLPFLALAVSFTALALYSAGGAGVYQDRPGYTAFDGLVVGLAGLLAYAVRLFLPIGLSAVYPYPAKVSGLLPVPFLLALPAAVLLASGLWYLARRDRRYGFAGLFFLATVLPGLQFLPVSPSYAFDHYTYVPYLGPFYLAGVLLAGLLERYPRLRPHLAAAALLLISGLGVMARERTLVWRDDVSLWSDMLEKYPDSDLALANRTLAYLERGEKELALADAGRLAAARPDLPKSFINRGAVLAVMKEYDKALRDFDRALELDPGNPQARLNRARLFQDRGDFRAAEQEYLAAARAGEPGGWLGLGRLRLARGDPAGALEAAGGAVEALPGNAGPLLERARLLVRLGRRAEAAADLDAAIALDAGLAEAWAMRAALRAEAGLLLDAYLDAGRALELDPRSAPGYAVRGYVLLNAGRGPEAEADLDRAIELDPSRADARYWRAGYYLRTGRTAEALAEAERVLALEKGHPLALELAEEIRRAAPPPRR